MLKPHITEKTLKLADAKQYTFELKGLKGEHNKPEVAKFVARHFKVTPIGVHTVAKKGKRFAIVRVKPNENIEGFEVKTESKK